jgi:DnaJ-domain-containing protein 1
MKKQNRSNKAQFSLGELILAVSSCSKSNRETVAAVADLLESGRVRFQTNGRRIRAHVY